MDNICIFFLEFLEVKLNKLDNINISLYLQKKYI